MLYEQWLEALAAELAKTFGEPLDWGLEFVRQCGEESWREMFKDGLSPADAASEEAYAAATMG